MKIKLSKSQWEMMNKKAYGIGFDDAAYDDMSMEDFQKLLLEEKLKQDEEAREREEQGEKYEKYEKERKKKDFQKLLPDEKLKQINKDKQPATASNTTKIKLSKSQWEFMGRKAGWMKG